MAWSSARTPDFHADGLSSSPQPWILPLPRTPPPNGPKRTCCLVTLGCPKNLVDSERMLGLLRSAGYELSWEPEGTDFVLVNTCGFIQSAREESLETIREMVRLKRRGLTGGVIVAAWGSSLCSGRPGRASTP